MALETYGSLRPIYSTVLRELTQPTSNLIPHETEIAVDFKERDRMLLPNLTALASAFTDLLLRHA